MTVSDLFMAIILLIQMGVGFLGNSFLLCLYAFTFLTGHMLRPIDSIFVHLFLANSIALLLKGILQLLVSFGLKNFLDIFECKFVLYIHRVARSVSLSITCLISGFQLIIISPSNSKWSEFKAKVPKFIVPSCLLCWCFYLLINFIFMGTINNSTYMNNNTRVWYLGYCSVISPTSFYATLYAILFSVPDFICVGFMICASAYLMILLHRHHQQIRHIHSPHLSPRTFPEIRATHTILLLVCTYVSFYSANSTLSLSVFQHDNYYPCVMTITHFMAACFPTISPFVVIACDSQILRLWGALWHRKSSKHHPVPKYIHIQHLVLKF
ncbi:vomeronasal type-1 receptor 4-like [Trichosurus vulpecula]|uniref:vomeronasal type-1 receptor 4-like n=1 Tax=Trichosurus vulpecula TaxID=9337 RepID=UPI00186B2E66|nr:vomeronasal type-1 receptor 4-like [Trichosurus vulpecula]